MAETITVEFGTFKVTGEEIAPKDENLIKINIKSPDGESEGIWAYIGDDTKAVYDKNVHDQTLRLASLSNASINGIPWGAYVVITLEGDSRPICRLQTLIDGGGTIQYNRLQYESGASEALAGLAEAPEETIEKETVAAYERALGAEHELVLKLKTRVRT